MTLNTKIYNALIQMMKNEKLNRPFWNSYLFGVKPELKALASEDIINYQQEKIKCLCPCKYQGKKSLLVITSLQIVVINRGLFGIFSDASYDSLFFTKILGQPKHNGRLFKTITFQTAGDANDLVITNIWGNHDARLILKKASEALNNIESGQQSQTTQKSQFASVDQLEYNLQKLNQLKEAGTISESEYAELRRELLQKAAQN